MDAKLTCTREDDGRCVSRFLTALCRDRLDQEKQDSPEPLPYLKEQPLGNLGLGQASSQVMAVDLFAV